MCQSAKVLMPATESVQQIVAFRSDHRWARIRNSLPAAACCRCESHCRASCTAARTQAAIGTVIEFGVCCWPGRHWVGESWCPKNDQHRRPGVLMAVVPLRKLPLAFAPSAFPEQVETVVVEQLRGLALPRQVASAGALLHVEAPRTLVHPNCQLVGQSGRACGVFCLVSARGDNQIPV